MQVAVQNAREEIMRSAISVFARKGYAGAGVQEILDSAGLSKPTLYYHFESKAGLFRAILDFAFDESYRLMREAVEAEAGTEGKLRGAAIALFHFARKNTDLIRLVLGTVFAAAEEIPAGSIDFAKRRRNFELIAGVLRDGQRTGELDPGYDHNDLAHGIFGAISHRIRSSLLLEKDDLNDELARRTVDLFLRGATSGKRIG